MKYVIKDELKVAMLNSLRKKMKSNLKEKTHYLSFL